MTDGTELAVVTVERPDEELLERTDLALELAQNHKITNPETAETVGEYLKRTKAIAKELEAKRKAITQPLNKALREVNALFKVPKDRLAEAESILKSSLLEYQQEQARIAREAQRKADEEAAKERRKKERAAKVAQVMRQPAKAEELHDEAEATVAPVVHSAAPKIEGVVTRETWSGEVTDILALVKHVADNPHLMNLIKIDQSILNDMARQQKESLDLPGVKAVKKTGIAARSS